MSLDILKKDIKNNEFKKVYLCYGPEEYLKKFYVSSIEKQIVEESYKDFNKIVLDGKFDINKFIDACETMPFFTQKKMVIVKDSGLFKAKKGGTKKKSSNDEILEYLKKTPDFNCIVFYESEIDKRMGYVNAIKKSGLLVDFEYQEPKVLLKWILKVVKSNNKHMDNNVALTLIEYCDKGMLEILNELNKVILYTGDRLEILKRDVEELCTRSIKSRIFDIVDAISAKDANKSLQLMNDMVVLKEPIPKIFFTITKHLRNLYVVKDLTEQGKSSQNIASTTKINSYVVSKLIKQSKYFKLKNLKDAINECLELDVGIKTGKINDRMAIEILITKVIEDAKNK